MVQLLESQGKEEPVSIRKLDTVEEVLKESDVRSNLVVYKLLAYIILCLHAGTEHM